MTKSDQDRFNRIELIIFGDKESNITGLVEFQKMDNQKWNNLEEYMRSNNEILQRIQEQNEKHYEMTLHQEERLKKVEIVFNTFGHLSKVSKRTVVFLMAIISGLASIIGYWEQIVSFFRGN